MSELVYSDQFGARGYEARHHLLGTIRTSVFPGHFPRSLHAHEELAWVLTLMIVWPGRVCEKRLQFSSATEAAKARERIRLRPGRYGETEAFAVHPFARRRVFGLAAASKGQP